MHAVQEINLQCFGGFQKAIQMLKARPDSGGASLIFSCAIQNVTHIYISN